LNAIEYSEPRLKTSSPLTSVFIDSLILDAAPSVGQKVREGYFDNAQSRDVDIKTIENTLQHMAGSKSFSDLYYMLSADEDKTNLIVHMNKAGEGTVSAGFHYDNNYHGSVLANLSIRNLFNTRTKFFTDLILGQNPRLKSLLILNNGLKPGFGVELDFYRFNLSQFEAGVKINSWNLENFGGQVFLPLTFKNSFMFKAGVQYDHFRYKQEVPDVADVPRADEFYGYGGAFAQFNYDSFNKLYFSTSGAKTEFKIKYVFPIEDIINKPANNTLVVYLKYDTNIKLGNRFVFKPGAFGGYTFKGDTPLLQHMFGVGGLNPSNYIENHVRFTGVHFIEDFTYHVGILRANMQYNVFDKFYLTAMNDFGFSERTYADLGWDGMVFGYGGKASYNSFIGPVEFSVMGSTAVKGATYFVNIGFWF
jgi:NTE family protein